MTRLATKAGSKGRMMRQGELVTFGGSGLERAAALRNDPAQIARLWAEGRVLALWRGKPLLDETAAAADTAALAYDAIAEVAPGGHFFAAQHTMERYQTAFYAPLVADLSNHGLWVEQGAQTADQRATAIWQRVLRDFTPPAACAGIQDRLAPFVADRQKAGGTPPED